MALTMEAVIKPTPTRLTHRHVWIVTGSGIILTIAAVLVGYPLDFYGFDGQITSWSRPLFDILPLIAAFVVGGLITSRRPKNIYGWTWLALGWAVGVFLPWSALIASRTSSVALRVSTVPLSRTIVGGVANQVTALSWVVGVLTIVFCLLYFPDGRLPSPRWRWLAWSVNIASVIAAVLLWAVPGADGLAPLENPFGDTGDFGVIATLVSSLSVIYIVVVAIPLAIVSLLIRYRQARYLERAQIRWLMFMAALNLVFLAIDLSDIHYPWLSEDFMTNFLNFLLTGLPLAVAVAIFRYRLYDIDVIIRKTVTYSLLTAVLALLYFTFVVLMQFLVEPFIGNDSPLVIVISTLLIAALFTPLRRRIQSFIDRRFYRRKYNAAQTLAQFSQMARDEVDMERLSAVLLMVVEETMQPTKASLWFREK